MQTIILQAWTMHTQTSQHLKALPRTRTLHHGLVSSTLTGWNGRPGVMPLSFARLSVNKTHVASPVKDIAILNGSPDSALDTAIVPEIRENPASELANTFNWNACWWPIHDVASLDPKIPMHIDLLGKSLVVWADTKGSWHCLEDRCPHRLAPLSEGRVEPQGLMCCYHGWTFDGNGSCTSIPQMAPDAEAAACSSKRACVKSYPTMVAKGLLWVWPEAGQTEAAQAAAPAMLEDVHVKGTAPWIVRDLPVRYDFLVENLIDPSHVDHAHHGVQGNRYNPMIGKSWAGMTVSPITIHGYEATTSNNVGNKKFQHRVAFSAPNRVRYSFKVDNNPENVGVQIYSVPTKPGWTRAIFNVPDRGVFNHKPTPSWLLGFDHVFERNAVLDGDSPLLHKIERAWAPSQGLGINSLAKAFYMPAKTDGTVIALRKWIQQFAGPIPTCRPEDEPFMPPLMTQEQINDRYNQHVKHCVHCKRALKLTDTAIMVTRVVGVIAAFAAVAQTVVAGAVSYMQLPGVAVAQTSAVTSWFQALNATGLAVPLAVSLVLVAAAVWIDNQLKKVHAKFFFEEYIHALKD